MDRRRNELTLLCYGLTVENEGTITAPCLIRFLESCLDHLYSVLYIFAHVLWVAEQYHLTIHARSPYELPTATGTSSPEPTVPAPAPDQATMAPTLEDQAPQQQSTSSGGDDWVPGVGDSWQYNLDTPVNTDVDADVFFIDLGEYEFLHTVHSKSCF